MGAKIYLYCDIETHTVSTLYIYVFKHCVEVLRPSQPNGVMSSAGVVR